MWNMRRRCNLDEEFCAYVLSKFLQRFRFNNKFSLGKFRNCQFKRETVSFLSWSTRGYIVIKVENISNSINADVN